jgi:hypothetical protein
MFESDIDALVKETFNITLDKKGTTPFDDFVFEPGPSLKAPTEQVPGVLYHLEKKVSTFVIRVYPSQNLAQDYKTIVNNPENYPSLRLLGDDESSVQSKLSFFECDSLLLAQSIKSELGNKRFPIFEEHILNVSDPSDSWWVNINGNQLKIFFKLSRTESMGDLVKLGPLGDTDHAIDMFNKLYGYFQMLFPVADYASAHGQMAIKCEREHDPIFKALTKIFLTGDADHEFWEYLRDLEMQAQQKPYLESLQKANLFLMEIATKRRFWKQIQEALED